MTERDPTLSQVIRTELHRHLVTDQDLDPILADLARQVPDHVHAILQLDVEHAVGHVSHNLPQQVHHFLGTALALGFRVWHLWSGARGTRDPRSWWCIAHRSEGLQASALACLKE